MMIRARFKSRAASRSVSGNLFQIEKNTLKEWGMMTELKEQIAELRLV